jgi:hypothetical protein
MRPALKGHGIIRRDSSDAGAFVLWYGGRARGGCGRVPARIPARRHPSDGSARGPHPGPLSRTCNGRHTFGCLRCTGEGRFPHEIRSPSRIRSSPPLGTSGEGAGGRGPRGRQRDALRRPPIRRPRHPSPEVGGGVDAVARNEQKAVGGEGPRGRQRDALRRPPIRRSYKPAPPPFPETGPICTVRRGSRDAYFFSSSTIS